MLNAFHHRRPRGGQPRSGPWRDGTTPRVPRLAGSADPVPAPRGTDGRAPEVDVAGTLEGLETPEGVEALDGCDAYVVLVADPVTGALDSYGPMPGPEALADAARRRSDLDEGDLTDVVVEVVRHHQRSH